MTLLVDTSVWSLALRRDSVSAAPEIGALTDALRGDELVITTGLILQELLQGFLPAKAHERIVSSFAHLRMVQPDRDDHVAAAKLRNTCRRHGVQLGTIDAVIAQLTVRHELTLLTTDNDFVHAAKHVPLRIWRPSS